MRLSTLSALFFASAASIATPVFAGTPVDDGWVNIFRSHEDLQASGRKLTASTRDGGDHDPLQPIEKRLDIAVLDSDKIDRRTITVELLKEVLSKKGREGVSNENRRGRRQLLKGQTAKTASTGNDAMTSSSETAVNFRGTTQQRKTKQTSKSKKSKKSKGAGAEPQVVHLCWPDNPTFVVIWNNRIHEFPAHDCTQEHRDEIQRRMETMFDGHNVVFTQTEPSPADATECSTLMFECGCFNCMSFSRNGGSILFGSAEKIDFHNFDKSDSAFVQAEFWQFLKLIDPADINLEHCSDALTKTTDRDEACAKAIVRQASQTAAHELGHLLSLRHHDSFGPPDGGLHPDFPFSAFYPAFDGLAEGDETFLHIMGKSAKKNSASGASVGLPLCYEVDRDNFFSERSMVKLLSNEDGEFLYESDVGGLNNQLKFNKLKTDILIPEGDNAGLTLDIQELLISGRINATGEVDFYRFAGKKGEVISAEFNGFDIYPWDEHDVVIGALNLYRENKDGAWTLVASNHQNFEGFDAFMVGALLEEDGNYIVQVFAPDVLHFGYGDFMSLDLYGFSEFCQGDYYLSIYKIDAKAQ